jgi:glycosyltransferase involved in cell wall biosynthesis
MKKVLVATYYWPPSGGPGVQRWLKFVKYLPQFGYQPVVLTVDPAEATYPLRDESLLNEVHGDTEVVTTPTSEPYSLYKKLLGKKEVPYSGFANEKQSGLISNFARFVRGNLYVPDARVGWNKHALKKALELIDQYQIETVITTSPPHSTQLLGLNIKKLRPAVKWIADLRDPWTDIFYYGKMLHLPFIRKKDARMERHVLMNADTVITVSNSLAKSYQTKIPDNFRKSFEVITNGFDPDDFSVNPLRSTDEFLTVGYTGTLSEEYDLSGFLIAISEIATKQPKPIKLNFTGSISTHWKEKLQNLKGSIECNFKNHVSHDEAILQMQNSGLLLLIIPSIEGNKGIVTGKIFEYIASMRPVLGIGPVDGDAADILSDTGAGKMFAYNDVAGIKEYIDSGMAMLPEPKKSKVYKYSRPALTEKLANLISG